MLGTFAISEVKDMRRFLKEWEKNKYKTFMLGYK